MHLHANILGTPWHSRQATAPKYCQNLVPSICHLWATAQASTPQADGQESRVQDRSSDQTIGTPGKKAPRLKRPEIDYDQNMKAARAAMKQAAKAVAAARALQKNEARKKQRLMKRASQLSSSDLERIAVMKRCGLFDPTT